jgi:hypothetical protein
MENNFLFYGLIFIADAILVTAITYFVVRNLVDRFKRQQKDQAGNIIETANARAKVVELEARDRDYPPPCRTNARRRSQFETPAGNGQSP